MASIYWRIEHQKQSTSKGSEKWNMLPLPLSRVVSFRWYGPNNRSLLNAADLHVGRKDRGAIQLGELVTLPVWVRIGVLSSP